MSSNWAYRALGALSLDQTFDLFGPEAKPNCESFGRQVFAHLNNSGHADSLGFDKKLGSLIGFDGKKWLVGGMALPSAVLDPTKYPAEKYSRETRPYPDQLGRTCYFLHGYESEHAHFPEKIPLVDAEHFRTLHEQNIIPQWDKRIAEELRVGWREADKTCRAVKTQTQFLPAHAEISLAEHLPQEAVDALKKAHAAGKPIAIHCDTATKEWGHVPGFAKDTEKFLSKSKFGTGSKIAIIGGTVALGALGAYWLFGRSKAPQEQKEVAHAR